MPLRPFCHAVSSAVFRAVDGDADVADAHRRAVLVGDHHIVPGRGLQQLIVVVDRQSCACGPLIEPLGASTVAVLMTPATSSICKSERRQLDGIDLHAHRGLLLAADRDLGDAGNLRDLLREDVLGVVVDRGHRQHVGMHRQDQDRRVGGIDLAVSGRRRQILRQLTAGGIDAGLHVLRRRVDVAVQVELQGDQAWCRADWSRSSATGRKFRANWYSSGCRHRRGHGLGAGARQLRET